MMWLALVAVMMAIKGRRWRKVEGAVDLGLVCLSRRWQWRWRLNFLFSGFVGEMYFFYSYDNAITVTRPDNIHRDRHTNRARERSHIAPPPSIREVTPRATWHKHITGTSRLARDSTRENLFWNLFAVRIGIFSNWRIFDLEMWLADSFSSPGNICIFVRFESFFEQNRYQEHLCLQYNRTIDTRLISKNSWNKYHKNRQPRSHCFNRPD